MLVLRFFVTLDNRQFFVMQTKDEDTFVTVTTSSFEHVFVHSSEVAIIILAIFILCGGAPCHIIGMSFQIGC